MAKLDLNLLYLFSENARISLKEAATLLGKSSQLLKYSVRQMIQDGVLKNPYCIFDYSQFGLILFRVYFRWGYLSEFDKNRIIQELNSNPYVISVYELTGEFELVVEFAAPNPSRFNKELKKLSGSIPMLNSYKIVLNLVTHVYPKYYLSELESFRDMFTEKIVGGDREKGEFTQNELLVMKSLNANPTIRMTSLSKSTGLNSKTAKSIIKNLQKRKIIRGYKYITDNNKLQISKWRLFLSLHNLSAEKEAKLMEFLLKEKEMVQVNKTVGDWDVEIDIESLDKTKIRPIIMRLREEFKEIIARVNLIEFYDYHKKSYLPNFIFENDKSNLL